MRVRVNGEDTAINGEDGSSGGSTFPDSASGLGYLTVPVGPGAVGTLVTSHATNANTKGSYVELEDSAPFTANMVRITVTSGAGGGTRQYLLDIATGAAAAEVVVVPDLLVQCLGASGNSGVHSFYIPLAVPVGTRVAARAACSTANSGLRVAMTLIKAGSEPGIASFVNVGAASADSGGTSIDPGGTADTKGAYVQLKDATEAVTQSLILMVSSQGNTAPTACVWAIDIATGAAASEVVLIPDIRVSENPEGDIRLPNSQTFITYIPAGTRIAVRASCSINDATDRLIDVALLLGTAA